MSGRRVRSASPSVGSKRSHDEDAPQPPSPEKRPRASLNQIMVSNDRFMGPRYTSSFFAPVPSPPPLVRRPHSFESWPATPLVTPPLESPLTSLQAESSAKWDWERKLPDPPQVPQKPAFDHRFYPHVVDMILERASWDVLEAFRGTCKLYRDKVHSIQSRQLIFFVDGRPPNAIRSPRGPVPSLKILHEYHREDEAAFTTIFSSTRVVDVIGCPREHIYSRRALTLAFQQRNLVLRLHPTNYRHDVGEQVCARKVVLFGAYLKSSWRSLPTLDLAQEKTVLNLKGLNSPNHMATVFKRFPPAAGRREAVVVFTHWGADKGYDVPMSFDHIVDPAQLARERLRAIVDLAAGMVIGGWLFPDMPPVRFTIVDFDKVNPRHFALDTLNVEGDPSRSISPALSLEQRLPEKVRGRVSKMVKKEFPSITEKNEHEIRIEKALENLRLVTLDEYAETLDNPDELELETVQLRYSTPSQP